MAAATIVNTSYGYKAHTGTDANSPVVTTRVKLDGIQLMGTSGSETVTIFDGSGTQIMKHVCTTANFTYEFDMHGKWFDGLQVTLSAGTATAVFLVG